ncbi:sensor histidine kinase [Marinospirillum sp.]|uniref:sensor histidine kinase n=1 Tax=Marinospirillum sp. TaxID=2183934 RepID=UPI002870A2DF|nr:sensor histidine kinase [Marinospirillum sp.]MDR9467227.1 sensor histidine kinase [Marinospirillum sp.]
MNKWQKLVTRLKKSSLQSRLLALLLLGFILIILASTTLVRSYLQDEYRMVFYEHKQKLLSSLVNRMEVELQHQEDSLRNIVEHLVTSSGWRPQQDLELLLQVALTSGHFDDYVLLDDQGVAQVDVPFFPGRQGTDYSDRPFVVQALEERKAVRSSPFLGRKTKRPLIAFTLPVIHQGELLGLLVGTHELLNNTTFTALSRDYSQLDSGELFILDNRKNLYVASENDELVLQPVDAPAHDLLSDLTHAEDNYGRLRDAQGNSWVYSKATLPLMDWTVLHVTPESQVLAPAESLLQQYLVMKLLMLAASGVMILFMVKRLLQPVRQAIEQLHSAVASDKGYQPLDTGIHGEIGQLLEAFNSLQAWRDHKERLADELVSIVSHELRTPLTSIQGSLKLLDSNEVALDSEQQKQLFSLAYRNTERLSYLVEDLLDMAAIKSGHLEVQLQPCKLSPLLEEAANNLACPLHSRQQQLIKLWPDKELLVKVDPQRFLQVLGNLLSNASKFSPEQSEIRLEVSSSNQEVKIAVIDQGPGIQPADQGRIFERFSQADASARREQGGAGLGLAIAKELTEAMGGHLRVESNGQTGSCFYIYLPLEPSHA